MSSTPTAEALGLVGLIGCGRVGRALMVRAAEVGLEARAIPSRAPLDELASAMADCATLVLAVSDDAIRDVAHRVATSGVLFVGVALHTSGLHGAAALAELAAVGVAVGSLHPLCSFADAEAARQALPRATFTVEGDEAAQRRGLLLGERLGARAVRLRPGQKPLYHAAAVVASNYAVALLDVAIALGESAGLPAEVAIEALSTLARTSLDNVARLGTADALTGPIARGDVEAVALHLEALAVHPDARELYRQLGLRAVEIARRAGT